MAYDIILLNYDWNKTMKSEDTIRGMTDKEISSRKLRKVHHSLTSDVGKAPQCIWDDTHTQGGHGFEWANVSGDYTSNVEDYLPMCIPCHRKFDTTQYQRDATRQRSTGRTPGNAYSVAKYKDGKFMQAYSTITNAAADNNMLITSICNNLKGLTKKSGGYEWRKI